MSFRVGREQGFSERLKESEDGTYLMIRKVVIFGHRWQSFMFHVVAGINHQQGRVIVLRKRGEFCWGGINKQTNKQHFVKMVFRLGQGGYKWGVVEVGGQA